MRDGDSASGGGRGGACWRFAAWGGAALLFLAPLVAMRFTDEVDWTAFDFAVFGALLALALGAFELGLRRAPVSRLAVVVAVGAAFLLAWAQLAVGVITGPAGGCSLRSSQSRSRGRSPSGSCGSEADLMEASASRWRAAGRDAGRVPASALIGGPG